MTYSEFTLPSGHLFSSGYVILKRLGAKLRRHLIVTHPADIQDTAVIVEALKNLRVQGREETLAGHVAAATICGSSLIVVGLENPEFIHMSYLSSLQGENDLRAACTIVLASENKKFKFVCETSHDYISWDMAIRNAFQNRNQSVTVTGSTNLRDVPVKLARSLSIKSLTKKKSSGGNKFDTTEMQRRMEEIENTGLTERITSASISTTSQSRQTLQEMNRDLKQSASAQTPARGREFTKLKDNGSEGQSESVWGRIRSKSRNRSRGRSKALLERSKSFTKKVLGRGSEASAENDASSATDNVVRVKPLARRPSSSSIRKADGTTTTTSTSADGKTTYTVVSQTVTRRASNASSAVAA